jgi:hypothetical protein
LGVCSCAADDVSADSVLIYVVSTGDDTDGMYSATTDLSPVIQRLADEGFVPVVHDETTMSTLTSGSFAGFEQVWVLEVDVDTDVDLQTSEVNALRAYFQGGGGGVWVSGETGQKTEDANAAMSMFNLESTDTCQASSDPKFIGSGHPALEGSSTLTFDDRFGGFTIDDPSVEVLWSSEGGCRGLAALSNSGGGRAFFDAGWVLAYAYLDDSLQNIDATVSIATWLGASSDSR